MIETIFSILLQIAGAYVVAGMATAVWFFTCRIKRLNSSAAGGSPGFRMLVTPGIIALWPVILLQALRPETSAGPDRAEELRHHHRTAVLVLAVAGVLVFAAALIWRAPTFKSLPGTEATRP